MLQAALDGRSPGTPRNNVCRNKRTLSQSSPEISSSPESPFVKKNFQSASEGVLQFVQNVWTNCFLVETLLLSR